MMKQDIVYITGGQRDAIMKAMMEDFAEHQDKALRDSMEQLQKETPYFEGFNGANKFFNRKGKRYGK